MRRLLLFHISFSFFFSLSLHLRERREHRRSHVPSQERGWRSPGLFAPLGYGLSRRSLTRRRIEIKYRYEWHVRNAASEREERVRIPSGMKVMRTQNTLYCEVLLEALKHYSFSNWRPDETLISRQRDSIAVFREGGRDWLKGILHMKSTSSLCSAKAIWLIAVELPRCRPVQRVRSDVSLFARFVMDSPFHIHLIRIPFISVYNINWKETTKTHGSEYVMQKSINHFGVSQTRSMGY